MERFDKLPQEYKQTNQPSIKYFHTGHKGVLTIDENMPQQVNSSYQDNYIQRSNYDPNGESKGVRYKLTEQMLTQKLLNELDREENLNNDYFDEPTSFVSEAHEKFAVTGFVSKPPKPIAVSAYKSHIFH